MGPSDVLLLVKKNLRKGPMKTIVREKSTINPWFFQPAPLLSLCNWSESLDGPIRIHPACRFGHSGAHVGSKRSWCGEGKPIPSGYFQAHFSAPFPGAIPFKAWIEPQLLRYISHISIKQLVLSPVLLVHPHSCWLNEHVHVGNTQL